MIVLKEDTIRKALEKLGFTTPVNLHIFDCIDSTNRYLKELQINNTVDICCAESQTQGRGRFGRQWHSPYGENIYFSSRMNWPCSLSQLSGLSLVTSLAVLSSLKPFLDTSEIKIKWPNDILWHDKKLSGILIELSAQADAPTQVITGIGLNVNSDNYHQALLDKPGCSLYELSQKTYDRNKLIASLITSLEQYYTQFIEHGLDYFTDEWHDNDYLRNKNITVRCASESFSGYAQGISKLGELIINDNQGNTRMFSSGDTTLKSN